MEYLSNFFSKNEKEYHNKFFFVDPNHIFNFQLENDFISIKKKITICSQLFFSKLNTKKENKNEDENKKEGNEIKNENKKEDDNKKEDNENKKEEDELKKENKREGAENEDNQFFNGIPQSNDDLKLSDEFINIEDVENFLSDIKKHKEKKVSDNLKKSKKTKKKIIICSFKILRCFSNLNQSVNFFYTFIPNNKLHDTCILKIEIDTRKKYRYDKISNDYINLSECQNKFDYLFDKRQLFYSKEIEEILNYNIENVMLSKQCDMIENKNDICFIEDCLPKQCVIIEKDTHLHYVLFQIKEYYEKNYMQENFQIEQCDTTFYAKKKKNENENVYDLKYIILKLYTFQCFINFIRNNILKSIIEADVTKSKLFIKFPNLKKIKKSQKIPKISTYIELTYIDNKNKNYNNSISLS